jgi:hypothetical protein
MGILNHAVVSGNKILLKCGSHVCWCFDEMVQTNMAMLYGMSNVIVVVLSFQLLVTL